MEYLKQLPSGKPYSTPQEFRERTTVGTPDGILEETPGELQMELLHELPKENPKHFFFRKSFRKFLLNS